MKKVVVSISLTCCLLCLASGCNDEVSEQGDGRVTTPAVASGSDASERSSTAMGTGSSSGMGTDNMGTDTGSQDVVGGNSPDCPDSGTCYCGGGRCAKSCCSNDGAEMGTGSGAMGTDNTGTGSFPG